MNRRKMGTYKKLRVRKQSHKTYNFLIDTIEYLIGFTLARSLSLLGASSNKTDFYNFNQVQSTVEQVEDAVRALTDDADNIKAAYNDLITASKARARRRQATGSTGRLELGIDIISKDQKTIVHYKVAAKVKHA